MSEQDPQPRRRRRTPETPPPAQGSVAKGAILVAVAVIIGFVLIRDDGIDGETSAVGADLGVDVDDGGNNDDNGEGTETTDSSTSSSVPDARDPSEVRVLVANGTNVAGAAGRFTEVMNAAGYQTAGPTDAIDKSVESSFVYFTAGYEAEARAVATELGVSPDNVTALPTAPVVNDNALANVIVVVGPQLANS